MVDQDKHRIKDSDNEPQAQISWHEMSARMGIVHHMERDADIKGTIEDTVTSGNARIPAYAADEVTEASGTSNAHTKPVDS
jgi:hypothetical protein